KLCRCPSAVLFSMDRGREAPFYSLGKAYLRVRKTWFGRHGAGTKQERLMLARPALTLLAVALYSAAQQPQQKPPERPAQAKPQNSQQETTDQAQPKVVPAAARENRPGHEAGHEANAEPGATTPFPPDLPNVPTVRKRRLVIRSFDYATVKTWVAYWFH